MKYQMGIMQTRHANLAFLICMISTAVLHNMQILLLALGELECDNHILTAAMRGIEEQDRILIKELFLFLLRNRVQERAQLLSLV